MLFLRCLIGWCLSQHPGDNNGHHMIYRVENKDGKDDKVKLYYAMYYSTVAWNTSLSAANHQYRSLNNDAVQIQTHLE